MTRTVEEIASHTKLSMSLRVIADQVQKNFCVPYAQDIDDAADVIDRMAAALAEILEHDANPQAKHVARRGLGLLTDDQQVSK